MATTGFDSGLDESRELVAPIPDVPLWSETGAYAAYDPQQNIGFWMHLGRYSYDPTLWHEAFIVYLPGGERLAFKNYGRGDTSRGPAGELLRFINIDPFHQWELHYEGPARRVSNDTLYAGGLAQGPEEHVKIDLVIDSVKPIWNLDETHATGQDWGNSHDQQLSEAHGTIVSSTGEQSFHGAGWRDHSRGPRDMTAIKGHTILGAWFADQDEGFVVTHVHMKNGAEMKAGHLFVGDEQEPLEADLPEVRDPHTLPMEFDVTLPTAAGDQTVHVEVLQSAPITMQNPNHLSVGLVNDPDALVIFEAQGRFRWNGKVGYGYVERSMRV